MRFSVINLPIICTLIVFFAGTLPTHAQIYGCFDGRAINVGNSSMSQAALHPKLKERANAKCEIEKQGKAIGEKLTARDGLLPGAHFGIIAKPFEYRTTLDFNIAFGAGQCGDIRVVVRYLDGGIPETMRVWMTRNGQNKDLFRDKGSDVTVRYCPATVGLTKFKVSAGERGRPVIALAKVEE